MMKIRSRVWDQFRKSVPSRVWDEVWDLVIPEERVRAKIMCEVKHAVLTKVVEGLTRDLAVNLESFGVGDEGN